MRGVRTYGATDESCRPYDVAVRARGVRDPHAVKVLTLVRFRPELDREEAWRAWAEHTRRWDSRDHPEIRHTRLTLFARDESAAGGFDGMALTEWSSEEAFRTAAAWYHTPESTAHAADLARFLQFDGMLTVLIEDTAEIPGPPAADADSP